MIFKSGIDTVNYEYGNKIRLMNRLNISKLEGQEFQIVGFIYKEYEDGYRCCFVTSDYHLIRLPKWYNSKLNNMTIDELEVLKSGDLILTDIHNVYEDNGYFTTKFKLSKKTLDNTVPKGSFNF